MSTEHRDLRVLCAEYIRAKSDHAAGRCTAEHLDRITREFDAALNAESEAILHAEQET